MATSSILNWININSKNSVKKLIAALEKSEATKCKEVTLSKKFEELSGDKLKNFFGDVE